MGYSVFGLQVQERWFGPATFNLDGVGTLPNHLSKRGTEALKEIRDDFAWVRADHTHLLPGKEGGRTEWWTFAGQPVNDTLAALLRQGC